MPSELTGRALDAAIHEGAMGRPVLWVHGQVYDAESGLQVERNSSDANAARLVLAEIERRGLIDRYVGELYALLGADLSIADFTTLEVWRFHTALPEAICRAALKAVRGGKP